MEEKRSVISRLALLWLLMKYKCHENLLHVLCSVSILFHFEFNWNSQQLFRKLTFPVLCCGTFQSNFHFVQLLCLWRDKHAISVVKGPARLNTDLLPVLFTLCCVSASLKSSQQTRTIYFSVEAELSRFNDGEIAPGIEKNNAATSKPSCHRWWLCNIGGWSWH